MVEDKALFEDKSHTVIVNPITLVPTVRGIL